MTSFVSCDHRDGVAVVTVDDGGVNVIAPPLLVAVNAALDRAEAEQRPVVLSGRDGHFSAGLDVNVLRSGTDAAADLLRSGFQLADRLLSFPTPVVIACTGHAIAMGAFLLLAADHRVGVSHDGFRVHVNEVAVGWTVPRSGAVMCRARLTPAASDQATVLATPFGHASAVAAGWLDEVCAPDEVTSRAIERASSFATMFTRRAFASNKRRIRASLSEDLRRAIADDDREMRSYLASRS